MLNKSPALDVWDTCCILGLLNEEKDKVPALLAQGKRFEESEAVLGICNAAVTEVVMLSDGSPALPKLSKFLDNSYIVNLSPIMEVSLLSTKLQYRFDTRNLPAMREKAMAAGCSAQQAQRLRSRDSEILATAIIYKAERLTTYDPFLRFLGAEYLQKETGLIIDMPQTSFLPLEFFTAPPMEIGAPAAVVVPPASEK
jgi:hypothetical protein